MAALVRRVKRGEPAEQAAAALGISLSQAMKLGFRVKHARPAHGTVERAAAGCTCRRCRRAAGAVRARGPRLDEARRLDTLDWLAWVDPDTSEGLSQAAIGKLAGVRQSAVSRIARAQEAQ